MTMEEKFDAKLHEKKVAESFRGHHILWISVLYCITGIAEATTNYLMPDTIRSFTKNALIFSVIQSLNPFFGFVAMPLAGWYSDRIWTRMGRRKPVILFGAACLALSCLGLPWSRQIAEYIPGLRGAVWIVGEERISRGLAVLAFWILVYQAMVDVVSIMVRSIIGDVIPTRYRAQAFGMAQIVSCCMIFGTMWWGSEFIGEKEWIWYALVAFIALLATLPASLMVKEHFIPREKKQRGALREYFAVAFRTPYFMRLCLVLAFAFVARMLIGNYYRSFTAEQLELESQAALRPFAWFPIIALFASYPVGFLGDRFRQYKLIALIGGLLAAGSGLIGVFAQTPLHLMFMAVLLGVATVCFEVCFYPYMITFMPPDKIGQLSGFANIFQGGPRFLMFYIAGTLIELMGRNYRLAFVGAVVCGILAVILLLPLPRVGAMGEKIEKAHR